MWEMIKSNPLLKTIMIAILGVLGFGFAFNIMFGINGTEMGQEMSGGYSLDNNLAYILAILIKILLIVIVITVIIALIKYSGIYIIGKKENVNSSNNLIDYIKEDPVLKNTALITMLVLIIVILSIMLKSLFGISGGYSSPYIYSNSIVNGVNLTVVIVSLVKFLLTISIVGLGVGSVVLFLQNKDNMKEFLNEKTKFIKCKNCSHTLKPEWKCCPNCGEDLDK